MKWLNKIELLNKLKDKYNDDWPSEIAEGFQMAIDVIEDTPTVEAVPVKWLEDYQIKEFIKADPNSVYFQRACGVGCAVEAWRKENEDN